MLHGELIKKNINLIFQNVASDLKKRKGDITNFGI